MTQDYKVIDMPSMMARVVTTRSSFNNDEWAADINWYRQIKEIYRNLLQFLKENDLLRINLSDNPIEDVVIRFSDLTKEGQAFVRSGADEKWLASFDRHGSKKPPTDVSSLRRALSKIKELR